MASTKTGRADEDISNEAFQQRHERALTDERKKFSTFLKFPYSTRSRANRRIDSQADSSGANTPDPMSPAPSTPAQEVMSKIISLSMLRHIFINQNLFFSQRLQHPSRQIMQPKQPVITVNFINLCSVKIFLNQTFYSSSISVAKFGK